MVRLPSGGGGRTTFPLHRGCGFSILGRMLAPVTHAVDLAFAERCLEGAEVEVRSFPERYREAVLNYLIAAGTPPELAREVVENLWADCLYGGAGFPPKLRRYNGECALLTFLRTIALNQVLTIRRWEQRWAHLVPGRLDHDEGVNGNVRELPGPGSRAVEAPLLELMKSAIETALRKCPPEDFVLVQLAHANGLKGAELSRLFQCSQATISRALARAAERIAAATLQQIREKDPWIELKWEDFLELCAVARPGAFGVE